MPIGNLGCREGHSHGIRSWMNLRISFGILSRATPQRIEIFPHQISLLARWYATLRALPPVSRAAIAAKNSFTADSLVRGRTGEATLYEWENSMIQGILSKPLR